MIRMLSARTEEIDDAEYAVEDILAQLEPESSLLKNSVGIMTMHADAVKNGVMAAVCRVLPFDVIGCTTLGCGTDRGSGMMQLSLSVITSDELEFSAVLSGPVASGEGEIYRAYREAERDLPSPPSLVLAFVPLISEMAGELMLDELSSATGNIPVFGMVSCDHTLESRHSSVMKNGEYARDSAALLLISGNISPRFFIAAFDNKKLQKQRAIVTSSEGGVIKNINNVTALEYLQSINLAKDDGLEGVQAIPFLVDCNDGTEPFAVAVYSLTPEGYAVCGGRIPEGSTLAISSLGYENVMSTSESVLGKITDISGLNGLLLFPCMSRNMTLGSSYMDEFDKFSELISGRLSYHAAYAGGELCPVRTSGGELTNRFHNMTLIACAF